MAKYTKRRVGAPCLCESAGHGHDERRCGQPVYGYTRGGNIRRVCDSCTHYSRMFKIGADLTPPDQPRPTREQMAPKSPAPEPVTHSEQTLEEWQRIMNERF